MTTSGLLAKIFLSLIIEWSHKKMVFSFIFATLRVVCSYYLLGTSQPSSRHTTQWTRLATLLCRWKYSVDASTVQPAVMWHVTVSWALPQLPSICFFKILRWLYLVLSVWSWAAMIKLSVFPLSPALLNQAQLASLSTKGFSRLQKNCPCIGFSCSSSVLSFSMLSFNITFDGVWTVDKSNIYSLLPLLPSREYFAFPASFSTSLQNLSLPCSI